MKNEKYFIPVYILISKSLLACVDTHHYGTVLHVRNNGDKKVHYVRMQPISNRGIGGRTIRTNKRTKQMITNENHSAMLNVGTPALGVSSLLFCYF